MSIFDLLFILVFLGTVIGVVIALALVARRKSDRARVWMGRVLLVDVIYFIAIAAVSVATPQRSVALGEAQCFDDWCITVRGSARIAAPDGDSVRVQITLSSRARGIAQGERDVAIQLVDGAGHRYRPVPRDPDIPLSVKLPPAGSQEASRLFLLPATARDLQLLVVHGWFPHCCIVGDRESVLHKAAVVRL